MDGLAGERESEECEVEESMEPDACFPDGEHYYSHCHHLTYYSLGVNLSLRIRQITITPLSLLRLCAKVQVLSGKCRCGPVENVVDAKKDLLPDSGAQLV